DTALHFFMTKQFSTFSGVSPSLLDPLHTNLAPFSSKQANYLHVTRAWRTHAAAMFQPLAIKEQWHIHFLHQYKCCHTIYGLAKCSWLV
ncbi:hypothetical protein OS493_040341, partial [Desmophyllum pertusum]